MPLAQFLRRLHYFLNRRRLEQELADDMAFHREMASRHGGAPFGNALRLREDAREAWGWTWIDRAAQDLRFASRMLRASPGFTLTAILMLAIGIGVNVAVFGFFNAIALRPLPVRDPATLLRFERVAPQSRSDNMAYPTMAFYREHSHTLASVLAVRESALALQDVQRPINAHYVTANIFQDLGARAALGRALDPLRDEAPNAEPVVVMSHGFWRRQFGSDASIIGRSINLNDKAVSVVGVAAESFSGLSLDVPDVWIPISQLPYLEGAPQALVDFSSRGASVRMWGRLHPGQSARAAEQELTALTAQLRDDHPHDIWEGERLIGESSAYPVNLIMLTTAGPVYPVVALIGALGLLILIVACSSLGSLLLARGAARDREISIRISVGAGRWRLTRQLLTENVLLASLGASAGLLTGYLLLQTMMTWTDLPPWLNAAPDWRVVGFAMGAAVVSALLFGLTPALQAARQRLRASFSRQFLIGAQVAASCVLLIVAGLLVRALGYAVTAHPGFEYQRVITIDPGLGAYSPAAARAHIDALRARLMEHAGVDSVAIASNPPLGNRWTVRKTRIQDRMVDVHVNNVDGSFFRAMSIPLLRGRTPISGEGRTIVVSETLANLLWPGDEPLGKSFQGATVVGVAGNAHLVSPEDSDAVEMYQLAALDVYPSVVVLIKTTVAAEDLLPFVTATARSVDPARFPSVQMMSAAFREKLRASEYAALSVGLLGVGALLLACLGIVGLVAYTVTQRTREIGIRMALGARPAHVLTVVLAQFSRPVIIGVIVGIGGAAGLSQVLRRVLYGISNLDPIAYGAAVCLFALTVAVAAIAPARRAIRVDPMRALRYE